MPLRWPARMGMSRGRSIAKFGVPQMDMSRHAELNSAEARLQERSGGRVPQGTGHRRR